MAPTPYPQDFLHSGSARPIELDVALTVPTSGDIIISVSGDISNYGWPSIPVDKKMVVTIGRGTPYEAKYLVSTITFGVSSSTLTVLAADRGFDGTLPVEAPAGTIVEHTISATEVSLFTAHMQTKQAHGSDGNLVDQNSAQALTNKTFPTPTASGHPATKEYADARLMRSGDTMTGPLAMGGNKVTGIGDGTAAGDAVTKGQLDAAARQPDHARAWRTGSQSGLGAGWNRVTFTGNEQTNGLMIPDSIGNITIPRDGVYLLTGYIWHEVAGSGNEEVAFLSSAGGGHFGRRGVSGLPFHATTSAVRWLPADSVVALYGYRSPAPVWSAAEFTVTELTVKPLVSV